MLDAKSRIVIPSITTTLHSYDDYRNELSCALLGASPPKRRAFARDVLLRMLPCVESAPKGQLWHEEVQLLEGLIETVWIGEFDVTIIRGALNRYQVLGLEDAEHATETNGEIIDFLSALDAYLELESGPNDGGEAAAIAESMMNILDFHFTNETPLDHWLDTAEIRAEFDRQLAYLR